MAGEKLDQEALKGKDNLTDDDYLAIQEQVLSGENPEKKDEDTGKPEVEKKEDEHKEEEEKSKEEKDAAEVEAAEAEKKKKEDEERLINAKEEDLSDEDKPKRAELIKARDEAKQSQEAENKKLKEDLDNEVKAYATEHKISEEEARTDFESREKILEKYKSDPKQLALANLHLQRMYTKSQESLKAAEEAKPSQQAKEIPLENIVKAIDEGKLLIDNKPVNKEALLDAYRKKNPDITDGLDDEAVIKLAAKDLKDNYVRNQEEQVKAISAEAKAKRLTLLEALSEADKKFIPEIQPILDKLPDRVVMGEDYSIDALVFYAKGKTYDADIKAHGEKEYKRGLEQAKILGQRENPSGTGNPKVKVKSTVTLTNEQKEEALNMFAGTTFTDDEKFAHYAALLKDENKDKDKK